MTLRQLHYAIFSASVIAYANTQAEYKRLSKATTLARRAYRDWELSDKTLAETKALLLAAKYRTTRSLHRWSTRPGTPRLKTSLTALESYIETVGAIPTAATTGRPNQPTARYGREGHHSGIDTARRRGIRHYAESLPRVWFLRDGNADRRSFPHHQRALSHVKRENRSPFSTWVITIPQVTISSGTSMRRSSARAASPSKCADWPFTPPTSKPTTCRPR